MNTNQNASDESDGLSKTNHVDLLRSNAIKAPTKLYDGGDPRKSARYLHCQWIQVSSIQKKDDPFLFYSIPENKARYLLSANYESENRGDEVHHGQTREIEPTKVRKTRISCEVHHCDVFQSWLDDFDIQP
mmetsp:Transcript_24339/g.50495  ORF Transcript_24339/g.50495 Transcript_24339/m.50495 type:complete len:131 (-) Transcript_24339:224-616(-)|eukprot:CAMPEP_0171413910 /NCGR_PEP_ID=MMETSP0880-20121228/36142_1 /TAXON_ID=67004 /ORGANISM="Thalassiosira weissflogii, Strain CCMP1336" /LENGTH=130 /DNA_ID=CAMNT_0011931699 /DNA_START=1 /DNA_END=396 /DNA_ORIENTATION=+